MTCSMLALKDTYTPQVQQEVTSARCHLTRAKDVPACRRVGGLPGVPLLLPDSSVEVVKHYQQNRRLIFPFFELPCT